jgi:hypothetical protein
VLLETWGQRIQEWQLDRYGLVGEVQASPARVERLAPETIELIPMGCARLRISAFPTVSASADAKPWSMPSAVTHEASHVFDDLWALSDGLEPKSSSDPGIPRFTWWDHLGTTEWVTWEFESPRTVAQVHVYWFDDRGAGQCRVPASWRLLSRNGRSWKPVAARSEAGVNQDRYNSLFFEPVETTALKLEVKLQPSYSGGILEWVVGPRGPS